MFNRIKREVKGLIISAIIAVSFTVVLITGTLAYIKYFGVPDIHHSDIHYPDEDESEGGNTIPLFHHVHPPTFLENADKPRH